MNSIFKRKNEMDFILEQMWQIVLRETGVDDDSGCDWFTRGSTTFIGDIDWVVSEKEEVANLVNAINALNGLPELINSKP